MGMATGTATEATASAGDTVAAARMIDAALWSIRSAQALLRRQGAPGVDALYDLAAAVPAMVRARKALP